MQSSVEGEHGPGAAGPGALGDEEVREVTRLAGVAVDCALQRAGVVEHVARREQELPERGDDLRLREAVAIAQRPHELAEHRVGDVAGLARRLGRLEQRERTGGVGEASVTVQ